jgi:hypothetical protein
MEKSDGIAKVSDCLNALVNVNAGIFFLSLFSSLTWWSSTTAQTGRVLIFVITSVP